jgi:beta-galactosidase GanA
MPHAARNHYFTRRVKRGGLTFTVAGALLLSCAATVSARQTTAPPHLRKQGTATQLVVEGRPFLVRGGELGNSTSSSLEYMRPVWPKLAALKLNTVVIPVYWELIEPTEGRFDFTLIDGLLRDARQHGLKLVPLWFASWKNSMSTYVPAWVKNDQKRFPRSQDRAGHGIEILSTFSRENMEADGRAFAAFMRHLREVDSREQTVIMVQVENEIGMIPDSRDRSADAERLFGGPVPAELMSYLERNKETLQPELRAAWGAAGWKTRGTWEEVFGRGLGTDEIFMAWYFARFTDRVTELGKAEYKLPMFVNAALIRPGYQPGQYPSAGPLPHLLDVWRAGAPRIDFLSPDIYFPNFIEWARRYQVSGNPLFIPEIQLGPQNSVQALYAFGRHDAIGFSPFSIESAEGPTAALLTAGYDLVEQLTPLIVEHQGKGEMAGLLPENLELQRVPQRVRLNGYALNVTYERPAAAPPAQANPGAAPPAQTSDAPTGGLVIATGPDEFVVAGTGLVIVFEADSPGAPLVGIMSAQEGKYVNGQWTPGRWLNGDQTHQGRHIRLPSGRFDIQRVKLYRYR